MGACDDLEVVFRYIYLTILSVYIPVGTFGAIIVIFTVINIRKLRTPHNYLLTCLCISDLSIILVLIPFQILRSANFSHCFMLNNILTIWAYEFFSNWFNIVNLCVLVILCFDKLLLVFYPIFYLKNLSTRKYLYFLLPLVVAAGLSTLFLSLIYNFNYYILNLVVLIQFGILLGLGLLLSIPLLFYFLIHRVEWKKTKEITKVINILALNFIIFLLPSFISWTIWPRSSETEQAILRLIRTLQPVTNGWIIALTRSVYRDAIKVLLRTNPCHWKQELRSIEIKKLAAVVKKLSSSPKPDFSIPSGDQKQETSPGEGELLVLKQSPVNSPFNVIQSSTKIDNAALDKLKKTDDVIMKVKGSSMTP